METLVKEKILEQFVNEVPRESATIQPINVDIKSTDVTRMTNMNTMKSNDGNYFIRYGGFVTSSSYNAIEVYSVDSLDNNAAIYVFDNLQIDNHTFFIKKMKQSEDGRFYAVAQYYDGTNRYNYLIIFNNFIQDGYCQINKYYTASNIGTNDNFFNDVAKVKDAGVYFILTESHLISFEINILEGNKTNIASIVDGGNVTQGSYQPQLNVLGDKLIFTKLWESDNYEYEYTKAIINTNEELPGTITLRSIYFLNIDATLYVDGARNSPYEAIIPILNAGHIEFRIIDLGGNILTKANFRSFSSNTSLDAYLEGNYAFVTDGNNLYLYYFDNSSYYFNLVEFYSYTFNLYYSKIQILKQYDMITLIGPAALGTQQSIVSIKNIYSPNTTSLPYYTDMFCLPAYMNLYSDSNDSTSLIFSRDATARFYSGNQVTSTFIVPNYLLNDGNIKKASIYGKTNYLLNDTVEDYEKNRFESLYFNFIYNLNVIDNTNGLNSLNQIGSNRIADTLWKSFIPMLSRLSKARITHEDLSREIIRLNLVSLIGGTATFNYQVSGNIVKIEYLSEDERTVYSTYRGQITGNHTITQVVKIIPNETATLSGTSIYISDSSNLTFANIQINGNSVQDGTPTPASPIEIESSGDGINLLPNEATNQTMNGLTFVVNEDKSITINGTATANTNYTLIGQSGVATEVLKLNANQNYYNTTSIRLVYRLVNGNYGAINPGAFTLSNDLSMRHIYLSIPNGTTYNNEVIYPQIIKGTSAKDYVPYGEGYINMAISNSDNTQSQEFTIPCQQPMRSIGNVRDEFIKQDGLWYEKHNIGVIESYNGETITTDFISTTGNLSTGAFIQYVLDDANYIECTQEQAQALESIIRAYTYDPITNINSTDETPAYLNVTYYKQL